MHRNRFRKQLVNELNTVYLRILEKCETYLDFCLLEERLAEVERAVEDRRRVESPLQLEVFTKLEKNESPN